MFILFQVSRHSRIESLFPFYVLFLLSVSFLLSLLFICRYFHPQFQRYYGCFLLFLSLIFISFSTTSQSIVVFAIMNRSWLSFWESFHSLFTALSELYSLYSPSTVISLLYQCDCFISFTVSFQLSIRAHCPLFCLFVFSTYSPWKVTSCSFFSSLQQWSGNYSASRSFIYT